MGRIHVTLEDKTEEKLRLFIVKKYPLETHGKISYVVEEAIKEYIKNHDP
jgi:hypothetical protein